MNGQARQWVFNLILWVIVEVVLTIVGIDDLASYSEFLFEQPIHIQVIATNDTAQPIG
jgi:hypothetical protein